MSDKTLEDLKVDAHIAVLHTKVNALEDKQKELTQRVRANEKVVAAVTLLGTVVLAVIGAGYFAPKAEACSPPLDGRPFTCPPWDDDVVTCQAMGICPPYRDVVDRPIDKRVDSIPISEQDMPDYYNQFEVTLFDTRDNDSSNIAHMGHSFPTGEWIEKLRNWESRRKRTSIEDMLNSSLADYENGSDGSTESEELLQLQSDSNR